MKAFLLTGPRRFEAVSDYPEPTIPGSGEVLLRVGAIGICGSDLHLYNDGQIGSIGRGEVFVPGHEFMGEVLAAGDDALDAFQNPLRPGQRVAVEPHVACHRCEWCERGDVNLCPHHTFIGLPGADGALRERMTVAARNCFPIPPEITAAGGALLEPLGVALHAVDLGKAPLGRDVAVIGCGAIGLLVLRLCRIGGANTIVAIDPHPARLALATKWGATRTIRGVAEESVAEAMSAVNERGFDLVFECAWTGPALPAAVELSAPGAQVMLVGISKKEDNRVPHSMARRKGLTLIFVRRMKHTYPRAIWFATGDAPAVPLDELVSHRFRFEESPRAFELNAAYEDDVIKAVIEL